MRKPAVALLATAALAAAIPAFAHAQGLGSTGSVVNIPGPGPSQTLTPTPVTTTYTTTETVPTTINHTVTSTVTNTVPTTVTLTPEVDQDAVSYYVGTQSFVPPNYPNPSDPVPTACAVYIEFIGEGSPQTHDGFQFPENSWSIHPFVNRYLLVQGVLEGSGFVTLETVPGAPGVEWLGTTQRVYLDPSSSPGARFADVRIPDECLTGSGGTNREYPGGVFTRYVQ